jgi:hypothetical protein
MKVQFHRTSARSYAITIYREGLRPVEMDPAPGYDAIMPHDLLHFVVEGELGLSLGIFGQVASGGNAGTFHPVATEGSSHRGMARLRRRASKRGGKLLREGRHQAARSERAAYICWYEWLARSHDSERRKLAAQMATQAKSIRNSQPPAEDRALTEDVLARVCSRLDNLSAQWANLNVGESFTTAWPGRTCRRSGLRCRQSRSRTATPR